MPGRGALWKLMRAKDSVARVSDQQFLRTQSGSELLSLCVYLDTLQQHSYPMELMR